MKNVYDEWNQEDGHHSEETTYDTLCEYVTTKTEKENLIDLGQEKAACFFDGINQDTTIRDEIEQSLEELSQKPRYGLSKCFDNY